MKIRRLFAATLTAFLVVPGSAAAQGNWEEVGRTPIPLYYYQGMTHDERGNRYFTGIWTGLYRTDPNLVETGRNDDVIPPDVHLREGYNHVGDPSYSGSNLYLPLECYYPPLGNTCNTGSIGVADPETLRLEYYVKLDPSEISKAMWCEVSPDGTLLWTQEGKDLLAYDMNDLSQAHAAPDAEPIKSVRRLNNIVPPEGITGATFIDERLFVAGQDDSGGVIYSIDLGDGSRRLETRTEYVGESEGLDDDFDLSPAADGLIGSLHYMVMPYNEEDYPTNGVTNGVIYHYEQVVQPGTEATSVSFTERSAVSGQYTDSATFEALLVDSDGDPLGGQSLTFSIDGSGQKTATTNADGIASASLSLDQRPGNYEVAVSYPGSEGTYDHSSTTSPFVVEREDSTTSLSVRGRGNQRSLQARLTDADDDSSGIDNRTVDFFADGELIGNQRTDSDGRAGVDLAPRYRGGHHVFEARFSGDDYFEPSSAETRT